MQGKYDVTVTAASMAPSYRTSCRHLMRPGVESKTRAPAHQMLQL